MPKPTTRHAKRILKKTAFDGDYKGEVTSFLYIKCGVLKYKFAKQHRFYDVEQLEELPGAQLLEYLALTTCPSKTAGAHALHNILSTRNGVANTELSHKTSAICVVLLYMSNSIQPKNGHSKKVNTLVLKLGTHPIILFRIPICF